WEYCTAPDGGCAQGAKYEGVKSVDTPDDLTVVITFEGPKPYPYQPFTGGTAPILQKAQFESCLGAAAQTCVEQNSKPVGTGPFIVTDFKVNDVVTALEWVRDHHRSGRLAVANLSLGVDLGDDGRAIIEMVKELAQDGVVTVAAAGNGDGSGRGMDACKIAPGSEPVALTVGATTRTDAAASYSNFGPCVDIWAPGGDRSSGVVAGWYQDDAAYQPDIGTSMAAPLVSGVLALLAQQQPGLCVGQVSDAIVERATKDVITGLDATSHNRLLRLDTAPIAGVVPPGRPSNVIVTPDSSSLLVGWDAPCDGGSPITSTKVSLIHAGRTVKSVRVDGTKQAVRVPGLVPGRTYSVVVKASNAVGAGGATERVRAPRVAGLRVGRAISADALAGTDTDGEIVAPSRVSLRSGSSGCAPGGVGTPCGWRTPPTSSCAPSPSRDDRHHLTPAGAVRPRTPPDGCTVRPREPDGTHRVGPERGQ
ncbi:MAG: hypothetical protein RJA51_594, partial [Actinomycetota bacterium]